MQHYYPLLLTIHLFCAITFVGAVFFEVLILEGIRKQLPPRFMDALELAIGKRARRFMPFVVLALFASGIGMVWLRYGEMFWHPFTHTFGLLLDIKILLAISVLGHFMTAMYLITTGKMNGVYFKRIHLSVFMHMLGIVFLAKAMFYWV